MTDPHAVVRAKERIGISTKEAYLICHDLVKALINPEKYHEYVELVLKLKGNISLWRFRVQNGIFYAVIDDGHVVTIINQNMLKKYKNFK